MSNLPSRAAACQFLGCADSELIDILESPAGVVYAMADGNALIDVDESTPDHDGKTGLMFAVAPNAPGGYKGDFPVFVNPPDDAPVERVTGLGGMSHDELIDHAREYGLDAKKNWSKTRLIEAIEIIAAEKAAIVE